ncbi:MAG: hypothetical protein ACK5N1_01240 [Gemmatimonas sp.]|jgi:hypothetical protein|uniref:hypothetical protein n=1 Tax=Gemmatimonas sp. TaxID=1962908 RepID=UPI0022C6633C|nr:hypothetical protein [Gemmatimonas sp.]MCZ8012019.1 hypothetical protein [Gemmatimonas sp.]MCZ8267339.1 hypothetical protein [Gemmatimonas sp.]
MPRSREKSSKDGKSVPQKGEISAAEMAQRLAMTPQAIGLWCKRPGAPVRVDGTRVWVADGPFQRWREKELVAQALKDLAPGVSLEEARTRKALAEAEIIEIEVAKKRGEIITIEDSTSALGVVLDRVTTLVRGFPSRLAHLGEIVEEAAEAEAELIIAELSEFSEDVLPVCGDERPAEAPV